MKLQEELSKRFEKAIAECIKPPVLVGPKWLRPGPGDGEFTFIGAPRIAKATGRKPQRIASLLRRRLDVGDLGLVVKVSDTGIITLVPSKPKAKQSAAAAKAKGQGGKAR
ncbi:MAG: hypothetical protein B1H04_00775 [Planctomycetales bacterium 4484_123]|nr:MAG: hypothetical protein B1H04_00775 [Planctomycetales bacterium 4484_123]